MLGTGGITRGRATAAAAAAALTLAAGCGGDGDRQDADDRDATYRVEVDRPEFPTTQALARETELRLTVRNADERTIPNLAATIEMGDGGTATVAFGRRSEEPDLSSRSRPAWIVDEGPLSGTTAYANTWALGPLPPGEERTFVWRVTPVEPGRYRLRYRLAGSLTGGARLETATGAAARGDLRVRIVDRPSRHRITDDGRIVRVPLG